MTGCSGPTQREVSPLHRSPHCESLDLGEVEELESLSAVKVSYQDGNTIGGSHVLIQTYLYHLS